MKRIQNDCGIRFTRKFMWVHLKFMWYIAKGNKPNHREIGLTIISISIMSIITLNLLLVT
jgi:hypothetical protein